MRPEEGDGLRARYAIPYHIRCNSNVNWPNDFLGRLFNKVS